MQEEDVDISKLPEEVRIQLFTAAVHKMLAEQGYTLEEFQAEFRHKFETPPEPLFYSVKPKTIKVGKLGEKLDEIPLERFEADEKISWSTSPLLGAEIRTEIFRNTDYPIGFNAAVAEILHQDISSFAICDINSTVGKGLVFIPSQKTPTLPAGTVLGLYAGVLSSGHTGKSFCAYGYKFKTSPNPAMPSVFTSLGIPLLFLDAEHFRNITSYIQHAPDENALSNIKNLPDEIKVCVACANILTVPSVHCGTDVLLLCTARDISPQKEEPALLLLDYGTYFEGKSYQLFDTQGNVVGTVNENNEFEKHPNYEPPLKPKKAPRVLSEDEIVRKLERASCEAQNFLTLYFFEQIKHVITLYQKRAIPGTEQILNAFAIPLAEITHAGTAHDVIDDAVTIRNLLDPFPALLPLKKELICLLKMHVAYLEKIKAYREALQSDPKTCPTRWKIKKGEWKTYSMEEKTHFGFFGEKIKDLRAAKNELAHFSPFITKWGKQDLLAIAVSVIFAREMEKKEQQEKSLVVRKK